MRRPTIMNCGENKQCRDPGSHNSLQGLPKRGPAWQGPSRCPVGGGGGAARSLTHQRFRRVRAFGAQAVTCRRNGDSDRVGRKAAHKSRSSRGRGGGREGSLHMTSSGIISMVSGAAADASAQRTLWTSAPTDCPCLDEDYGRIWKFEGRFEVSGIHCSWI